MRALAAGDDDDRREFSRRHDGASPRHRCQRQADRQRACHGLRQLPGELDAFVFLLHLRPNDTVQSVESNLLHNLLTARTEQFYDQSMLYDIVSRLLGRRCPGIGKIELYRFFENSVKPRITRQQEDLSTGLNGLHRIVSHAAGVPYCGGVTLAYTHLIEWRGSKDPQAAAKRTQFSSIELQ